MNALENTYLNLAVGCLVFSVLIWRCFCGASCCWVGFWQQSPLPLSLPMLHIRPSSNHSFAHINAHCNRYFERLQNHKTTLDAQRRLQLPYFKWYHIPYLKNRSITIPLSSKTVHMVSIRFWIMFTLVIAITALIIALIVYFFFLVVFFTGNCYWIFNFISASIVGLPQLIFRRNRILSRR